MSRRFVLILLACVAAFFGILFVSKHKAAAPTSGNGNNSSSQLSNHTTGSDKSGVTFIEYGDFQCPACYAYEPTMIQLRAKYKDQITFQFRNFPLVEVHKNALAAARAAEAAAIQGKFWEMHDKLYETQDPRGGSGWVASNNPSTFFDEMAQQLGLNITKFKEDSKSEQVNNVVQADRSDAKDRLKFTGTPSFVLDGKALENTKNDLEYFSKLIDAAIKSKSTTQKQ